eukprot:479399-Pleurochrysis_carterae.AAC.1
MGACRVDSNAEHWCMHIRFALSSPVCGSCISFLHAPQWHGSTAKCTRCCPCTVRTLCEALTVSRADDFRCEANIFLQC